MANGDGMAAIMLAWLAVALPVRRFDQVRLTTRLSRLSQSSSRVKEEKDAIASSIPVLRSRSTRTISTSYRYMYIHVVNR